MVDITQPMQDATSTPQEAADNINNSNVFNIGAEVFKNYKEDLQPKVEALKRPTDATPIVAKYVEQSPEHAALAAPDMDNLNYAERQIKLISDYVGKRRTNNNDIVNLGLKAVFHPDTMTDDDRLKMFQLNTDAQGFSDYGINGPYETLPAKVAGALVSTGEQITKNAKLIAAATGIGAGAGFFMGGPPGALAAGTSTLTTSSLIAMAKESTDSQIGGTYNELSNLKNAQGQPLNVDEDTKRYISMGVGVTTGAIVAIVGKTVAGTIPFLRNILSPKMAATIVSDPAKAALKEVIFDIGKSIATGGGGAATVTATQVIGEEMAKHYDGTEGSYLNALYAAKGRIAESMMVGGLTTGAITATAGVAGFNQRKQNYITEEQAAVNDARDVSPDRFSSDLVPKLPSGGSGSAIPPETPVSKAVTVLHFEDAIANLNKATKGTEMYKIAQQEYFNLMKQVMDDSQMSQIFFDRADLTKAADNEQKASAIRKMIGVPDQNNAPISVEPHKFMEANIEYPDLATIAKLSPEGPNPNQAREYLERIQETDKKRSELLTKLGTPDLTEEQKTALKAELVPVQDHGDIVDEQSYLNQPTFTKAIEKVLTPAEVSRTNEAFLGARKQVLSHLQDAQKYEMDQVRGDLTSQAEEATVENEIQKMDNDPNVAIVDQFNNNKVIYPTARFPKEIPRETILSDLTANHARKGFSPFAIDPETLPKKLQKFANNPQLKKHKVFVNGGINADEAAHLLGVNSGENLLKILAATPSRKDILEAKMNLRQKEIADAVNDSMPLEKTELIKSLTNAAKLHIEEMRILKSKDWPALKGTIKRIALPLPTIGELSVKARAIVNQTPVKQLNVNQYKVGERRSQRLAMEAILKGEIENAFRAKEAAALNVELQKETHLAIGQFNRMKKFLKRSTTKEFQQNLKDAGPTWVNGFNELAEAFNLNPKKSKLSVEAGAYAKWAKKMIESGEGDFQIPEKFSDVRQSIMDAPVQQALIIGDRLKNLEHTAKYKNRLYTKYENINTVETEDAIAATLHEQAVKNFEYDPKKVQIKSGAARDKASQVLDQLIGFEKMLERPRHIIVKLDNGQLAGLFDKTLYVPLKNGAAERGRFLLQVRNEVQKRIEDYGKSDFHEAGSKIISVPEFKGIGALNDGNMTKMELVMMAANFGNEGNINRLLNYGLSKDILQSVLDRELESRDIKFVQEAIWNVYKSFEERTAKLQLETEGTEAKFVQPSPFTHRGIVYPGGYFPIFYNNETNIKNIREKLLGSIEMNKMDKFRQKYYSQAMTDQGYLEERTGSKNLISLNSANIGQGFEQHIQDLTMRVPIRDTYKLLANEQIAHDVASIVGVQGYEQLANAVIAASQSAQMRNFSNTDGAVLNFMNQVGSGIQSVMIVGKLTTLGVHPTSLMFAVEKMGGANGAKYIAQTLTNIMRDPSKWKEFTQVAGELHAPILESRESIDNYAANVINRLLPKNAVKIAGIPVTPVARAIDFANEIGFHAISQMDQFDKTLVVLSAYTQAMSGDAKGVEATHEAAKHYASQVAHLTQPHGAIEDVSEIQRSRTARPALFFFNIANTLYNNTMAAARVAKQKFNESGSAAHEGEYKTASKATAQGIGGIMTFMIYLTAANLYENLIRGQPTPFDSDNTLEESMKALPAFYLRAGRDQFLGTLPLVRDINFAALKDWSNSKDVSLPFNKVLSDTAQSVSAVYSFLDFTDTREDLTPEQIRGLLYTFGYITKFPSDAVYKYLIAPDYDLPTIKTGDIQKTYDKIKSFIKKNDDNPEIPKEFLKQLENLEIQIKPADSGASNDSVLPPGALDVIKQIESGAKWWAKNPNSSAAGLYQFTESTWKDIMNRAPELGLTENGRVAKNTEQQEKAMEWFTTQNVQTLAANDIPITTDNVYAAHFLGADAAVKVLQSANDTKLKTLVGTEVMNANGFKNSMKVKDFKEWLRNKTENAQNVVQNSQASVDKVTQ